MFYLLNSDNSTFVDFTVGTVTCPTYVTRASKKRGFVADLRTKDKHKKYRKALEKLPHVEFKPVAMESHGYMSKELFDLIKLAKKKLISKKTYRADMKGRLFSNFWKKRFSILFMNYTTRAITHKLHKLKRSAPLINHMKYGYQS